VAEGRGGCDRTRGVRGGGGENREADCYQKVGREEGSQGKVERRDWDGSAVSKRNVRNGIKELSIEGNGSIKYGSALIRSRITSHRTCRIKGGVGGKGRLGGTGGLKPEGNVVGSLCRNE